ncbi:MAG: response regulator transcription factor [Bacteroidetes bacterium]|nr:response regulator transcription factor [Bacteroidota bacterium]MCH8524487.1 LytTR family DNA-binding domain-containing protein [Balneolales bacterium]
MKKLSSVIIDDQQHCVDDLSEQLKRHENRVSVVGVAYGYEDGMQLIETRKPDIIFLDVELGEKTGFDILADLPKPHPTVVFVSAMAHYSLRAIKVNAADYLLKPVNDNELENLIIRLGNDTQRKTNQQATNLLKSVQVNRDFKPDRIAIRQTDSLKLIYYADLVYVEADSNYSRFHTATKDRITASMTLKEVEETLISDRFLRTHKSYLVNREYVDKVAGGDHAHLILRNGEQIPIARRRVKEITERLRH